MEITIIQLFLFAIVPLPFLVHSINLFKRDWRLYKKSLDTFDRLLVKSDTYELAVSEYCKIPHADMDVIRYQNPNKKISVPSKLISKALVISIFSTLTIFYELPVFLICVSPTQKDIEVENIVPIEKTSVEYLNSYKGLQSFDYSEYLCIGRTKLSDNYDKYYVFIPRDDVASGAKEYLEMPYSDTTLHSANSDTDCKVVKTTEYTSTLNGFLRVNGKAKYDIYIPSNSWLYREKDKEDK